MEERIRKAIADALSAEGAGGAAFAVERPTEAAHGDYATNAALVVAKALGERPHALAERLAEHLRRALLGIAERVEVAGPGFVNVTLSREAIALAVAEAAARGEDWGKGTVRAGQRVMIEYTDPNPFKPMHIGHLMSNIIGEALARLTESEGASVTRANYGGDVGPHVAKALWGLRAAGITEPMSAEEIGKAYTAGAKAYEDDPKAKEEIDALNAAVYDGTDEALMNLWRRGREVSLRAFSALYEKLGSKFDYFFFESETAAPGLRLVADGLKKGVFEESEGALIYRGEAKGLHTLVFVTSRGTPTYEAKDLGLAFLKEERASADESVIVTAAEQIGHFRVVFAALAELAPLIAAKTRHVPHGFLRLATGKMSSREGNVITAADFITDVIKKAAEKNPDPQIAEQVAIGAVKFMVLRQAPGQDIIFDPEKSLSLEGDSGPYLQYALVRAAKILGYASEGAGGAAEPVEPYPIERLIVHFPEIVARAAREMAPNLLVNYLLELVAAWNPFYASEQVLGSPEEQYKERVARAFANTMANGLSFLGIPAPEKM